MTREERVLAYINNEMKTPLKPEELAVVLDVPQEDMAEFNMLLFALLEDCLIVETKRGKIAPLSTQNLVNGKFIGNERGFGFVETGDEKDVFISAEHTNGALHGDTVLARVTNESDEGRRAEGEVLKIIKDTEQKIVGRIELVGENAFISPIFKKFGKDFFVRSKNINGAKEGDMVVAQLTVRGNDKKKPEAKVVATIGNVSSPGVDILAVLESQNVRYEFPEEVKEIAKTVPKEIDDWSIAGRLDLRHEQIITIDGDDAKDLDDAVCVKKLENGNYELGVHIADVSHYVAYKNPFDEEAYKRGTSIYLADRVVPMLPEQLSNGICSLNQGVDRLTLSVIMEIDTNGKVVDHKIAESVINSTARMTYSAVTAILEGDNEKREKYAHLVDHIEKMNELRKILNKQRNARGSINFDFDEARIVLDENGKPVDVVKRERGISNNIIEEFMLIANETVAEHFFWLNIPFIYRVHEEPNTDSIKEFAKFIAPFGYTIKHSNGVVHPRELAELIKKLAGKKEEIIISGVMLRSLMKAKYSQENAGHFGLSSKYYCHFTSPIRRYPDLASHRSIKATLNGELNEEKATEFVKKAAKHSSDAELAAVEVERTVEDMKKAEFMQNFLGEVFDATISNVTSFGIFAALENTIEGLIRFADLTDDYYVYDEA
ncbi:MAG: ribonuclease R, partial [Clostridia bacterium]|nr:ribonuclease R [Clostridia bacterium]